MKQAGSFSSGWYYPAIVAINKTTYYGMFIGSTDSCVPDYTMSNQKLIT
jgi:hypothetical protein